MVCAICKVGEPRAGVTTMVLEAAGGAEVVVRRVPALVCPQCGERYVDAPTTDRLIEIAAEAARPGVDLEVREYTPS